MHTDKETTARALGSGLPISRKKGIEICNYIRGKPVQKAKKLLEQVIAMKRHVPFKRFTEGAGHQRGEDKGPGKYPIKACGEILKIVKLAEANAQFKGLNTESLVIKHISCQQAPSSYKAGRQRGRKTKTAHIEIIVEETEKKKESKAKKKEKKEKTEEAKKESAKEKPEAKKELTGESSEKAKEQKQPETSASKKTAAKPEPQPAETKKAAKIEAEQAKAEAKQKAQPSEKENQLK